MNQVSPTAPPPVASVLSDASGGSAGKKPDDSPRASQHASIFDVKCDPMAGREGLYQPPCAPAGNTEGPTDQLRIRKAEGAAAGAKAPPWKVRYYQFTCRCSAFLLPEGEHPGSTTCYWCRTEFARL